MKQSKTTNRKNKSHGLFFSLLKNVPGYDPKFRDVIKEGIVSQYSKGKTESLSIMYEKYPREYAYMIECMKGDKSDKAERYDRVQDLARKRVIAAICGWLDRQGYKFDTKEAKLSYAISIACKASNCNNFNLIAESKLTEVYSLFCKKNLVNEELQKLLSITSKN